MRIIKINERGILVRGNIATEDDYQIIRQQISKVVRDRSEFQVRLAGTKVITSSVLGYFLSLNRRNKVSITLYISEIQLFALFKEIHLIDVFPTKRLIL